MCLCTEFILLATLAEHNKAPLSEGRKRRKEKKRIKKKESYGKSSLRMSDSDASR